MTRCLYDDDSDRHPEGCDCTPLVRLSHGESRPISLSSRVGRVTTTTTVIYDGDDDDDDDDDADGDGDGDGCFVCLLISRDGNVVNNSKGPITCEYRST